MLLGIRQKFGPLPQGSIRGFVSAAGGTVEGPRLNGRVVPNSGGDWALYRDDHTVGFDARYMLEADDGTPIYMMNRGYPACAAGNCRAHGGARSGRAVRILHADRAELRDTGRQA